MQRIWTCNQNSKIPRGPPPLAPWASQAPLGLGPVFRFRRSPLSASRLGPLLFLVGPVRPGAFGICCVGPFGPGPFGPRPPFVRAPALVAICLGVWGPRFWPTSGPGPGCLSCGFPRSGFRPSFLLYAVAGRRWRHACTCLRRLRLRSRRAAAYLFAPELVLRTSCCGLSPRPDRGLSYRRHAFSDLGFPGLGPRGAATGGDPCRGAPPSRAYLAPKLSLTKAVGTALRFHFETASRTSRNSAAPGSETRRLLSPLPKRFRVS